MKSKKDSQQTLKSSAKTVVPDKVALSASFRRGDEENPNPKLTGHFKPDLHRKKYDLNKSQAAGDNISDKLGNSRPPKHKVDNSQPAGRY